MQIRKLTPQEAVALNKAQSICFLFPTDVEKVEKQAAETPDELGAQWSWGAFDDAGMLLSGMIDYPYEMYYEGHVVGAGGIGGVVTLPEGRMKGNIRSIFQAIFAEMRRDGKLFSVLYPFSQRYYRQFGYEVCLAAQMYSFPTKELSRYRQTDTARMHQPGEPDEDFRKVHAAYASRYNYAFYRGDMAWKRVLRGNPYKCESHRYVFSRDGEPVAYLMLRPERIGPYTCNMLITDFAFIDTPALHSMLGFMHRLSAQFENVLMELPSDLPAHLILDEPNEITAKGIQHTMARVIDVKKALELLRHPKNETGAYTIYVHDAFLPENEGTYSVSFSPAGVQVSHDASARPCDLSVDVTTLAQLCLGCASLSMALLRPDVQLHSNRELLERVFVVKPRSMSDRF